MALEQRRFWVIYDKITGEFLSKYNSRNPLKSHWTYFYEESQFLRDVELLVKRRSGRGWEEEENTIGEVMKGLEDAFQDEPGGADFSALRVKPKVVYELEEWPEFIPIPGGLLS